MKTQLKKNEKVLLTIRKHWFVLLKPALWTFLFFVITVAGYTYDFEYSFVLLGVTGLSVLWFIFRMVVRNFDLWAVTNLRVIDEYGVFTNNSKETPLDKINNVSYRQPLLGRIFNYGHVQIQSAAEAGASVHSMIEKPRDLKDTITQAQERYKQELIKEQAQSLANVVGGQHEPDKTDIYEELTKLHELKEKGIITEEDFQKRKIKILGI